MIIEANGRSVSELLQRLESELDRIAEKAVKDLWQPTTQYWISTSCRGPDDKRYPLLWDEACTPPRGTCMRNEHRLGTHSFIMICNVMNNTLRQMEDRPVEAHLYNWFIKDHMPRMPRHYPVCAWHKLWEWQREN